MPFGAKERVRRMTEQRKAEIIKALAYGETPEQAAEAEDESVAAVQQIVIDAAAEIAAEREVLKKAGYLRASAAGPPREFRTASGEPWIDVSAHQGAVDWAKVKAAGIKGAVIRAGYGNDPSQQDVRFAANIAGAQAAGLKTAVYWFSYADSIDDAIKEWGVCQKIIGPYKAKIRFVASDYEYDSMNYYRRIHGMNPTNALINSMVVLVNSVQYAGKAGFEHSKWATPLVTGAISGLVSGDPAAGISNAISTIQAQEQMQQSMDTQYSDPSIAPPPENMPADDTQKTFDVAPK